MRAEAASTRVSRCAEAVQEQPRSAVAHYNLGLAHTQEGRVDRAEREYRSALDLDPDLVQAWVNLGGVRLLKWDFRGSLEANLEAVRRQDDLLLAHFNMGQAYIYLEDAEKVVECNRRVLELDPAHPAGHYFLAVGLLATGRTAAAREAVSRAMALGYRPRPEFLRSLERAEQKEPTETTTRAPGKAATRTSAKEE